MSRTLHLSATATVAAPPADVWSVLADYARDPEWRTGVVSMTSTPSGVVEVGTVTDEELRLGGRTYRNLGVVEMVDPGGAFTWRTTEGADAHGCRRLAAAGPGRTSVTLELHVTPHGFERVLAPVLGSMLRRNLHRDLATLDRLVRDAHEPVPGAGGGGRSPS